ncbi:hypothetical protein ACNSTU_00240 [Aquisalimonas sp. APHAB1-3]|uniref:hypothetical protein n=1 Tax=Aquisalimonas sp. APHAB1-3 TaxID=3402080 RepID=UPI003AAFC057
MCINNKKTIIVSLLAVLALSLGGCISSGGSGSSDGGGDPGGDDGLELSDVSLAATDGLAPFRLVSVDGLPDDAQASDLHARYRAEGDSTPLTGDNPDASLAPLASFRGGPIQFLVPLVEADGATIEMRITDGVNDSQRFTVAIDPLPPRDDGAWERYLDALETLIEQTADAYELAPSQISAANADMVEFPFVPLVLAQYALDGEGNTFALRNADFDQDDLELIERIIPHMGLTHLLESDIDFVGSDQSLIDESLDQRDAPGSSDIPTVGELSDGLAQAQMAAQIQQQGYVTQSFDDVVTFEDGTAFIDGFFEVDGPEAVDSWMSTYDSAWRAQGRVDTALGVADDALTAATILAIASSSGAATPQAVAARAATRKSLEALLYGLEAGAGVSRLALGFLPCCLHEIDTSFDPSTQVGETEDGGTSVLRVDGVTARMKSDGTDFGKEILERFIISELGDNMSDALATGLSQTNLQEQVLDAGFGAVFGFDADLFDVHFVWEGVDIAGPNVDERIDWDVEGLSGAPATFREAPLSEDGVLPLWYDEDHFFGRETEDNAFYAHPVEDEDPFTFGPWHPPIPEDRNFIRGTIIRIVFDPNTIDVDAPGEQHEFTVEVRNAEDATLEYEDLAEHTVPRIADDEERLGTLEQVNRDPDAGTYTYRYTAPDDLEDFQTVTVRAEAASTEGVRGRESNPPGRIGSMLLRGEDVDLAVDPQRICLDEGGTQTFEAVDPRDPNGETLDVTWEADVGSMSGATYTAPNFAAGSGTDTVTATLVADDQITAEANIALSCDCWYDVNVGNNIDQSYAAGPMGIRFDEDGNLERIDLQEGLDDSGIQVGMTLSFEPPVPAGDTGTFDARIPQVATFLGDDLVIIDDLLDRTPVGSWWNLPLEDEEFWGRLSLIEADILPPEPAEVPPVQVTIDRHEMWSELPDGSEAAGGERSLSLAVEGQVRRLGAEDAPDDQIQVVVRESGPFNLELDGEFWGRDSDRRQFCQPLLGL